MVYLSALLLNKKMGICQSKYYRRGFPVQIVRSVDSECFAIHILRFEQIVGKLGVVCQSATLLKVLFNQNVKNSVKGERLKIMNELS